MVVSTPQRTANGIDAFQRHDDEAIRAAALWRFKPGTRFGQPVPVIVRIELEFTLR